MFYTLTDAIIFEKNKNDLDCPLRAVYQEEVPLDYVSRKHQSSHRIVWMFGFDGQHRTLAESLKEGTGFEPWIWFYEPHTDHTSAKRWYKEVLRLNENVNTDWTPS
eukprot:SAG31_NODE_8575_length_1428_cov_1.171558_2_plen_105_part_01